MCPTTQCNIVTSSHLTHTCSPHPSIHPSIPSFMCVCRPDPARNSRFPLPERQTHSTKPRHTCTHRSSEVREKTNKYREARPHRTCVTFPSLCHYGCAPPPTQPYKHTHSHTTQHLHTQPCAHVTACPFLCGERTASFPYRTAYLPSYG
mmetsp:Transcript_40617/g.115758  ORF Transcript_40617/g.115758 Transcript_40617/m.115758 type:complete len:149 (-) Transcript_40617:135-581(-)